MNDEIKVMDEEATDISVLQNPFLKDKIDSIDIEINRPSTYFPEPVKATIWFRNGNTRGNHTIKGYDLFTVARQAQELIDTL